MPEPYYARQTDAGVFFAVARVRAVAALLTMCSLNAVLLAPGVAASSASEPAAPVSRQPMRHEVDLPAQDLAQALATYQTLTQQSVLYETRLVEGKTSAPVRGLMTARQALSAMLGGTGLTAQVVNERSVMLKASAPVRTLTPAERLQRVRRYDGVTQVRLRQALCAHPALQPGKHRMALRYWLDGQGRVARVKVRIADNPDMEGAVTAALKGLYVGIPPEGVADSTVILIEAGTSAQQACRQ